MDATYCYEHILEAAPQKKNSNTVTYLPSKKQPNKPEGTCWALLSEERVTHKQCSHLGSYRGTYQYWPASKYLHIDTIYSLEDQSGIINDGDGGREMVSGLCVLSTT